MTNRKSMILFVKSQGKYNNFHFFIVTILGLEVEVFVITISLLLCFIFLCDMKVYGKYMICIDFCSLAIWKEKFGIVCKIIFQI